MEEVEHLTVGDAENAASAAYAGIAVSGLP